MCQHLGEEENIAKRLQMCEKLLTKVRKDNQLFLFAVEWEKKQGQEVKVFVRWESVV